MEVRVLARNLLRFVPDDRVDAEQRLPVELHETRLPGLIDEAKGVNAEAFHHAEAAGNGSVGHNPHDHVHRFRHQGDEVPEGVVRRRRLRDLVVRLRLDGVDQVGKLDGILDEEDGDVVSHQVKNSFLGVELDREAAHVARQVARAARAGHRRETDEDRGRRRRVLEELRPRELRHRLVDLEGAVRRRTARMDDALGDALVVEMGNLLAQDEIFEQGGAARPRLEGVLVVVDPQTLVGGQELPLAVLGVLRQIRLLGIFDLRLGICRTHLLLCLLVSYVRPGGTCNSVSRRRARRERAGGRAEAVMGAVGEGQAVATARRSRRWLRGRCPQGGR